jgi:hypothetical protein
MRSQVLEEGDLATALADVLRQLTTNTSIPGEITTCGEVRQLSLLVENLLLPSARKPSPMPCATRKLNKLPSP